MRRAAAIVIASLALAAGAPIGAALAQDAAPAHVATPRLTVSAVGSVEVPADQVDIQLSVVSDAKTADAALAANQTKVEAMLAALKALGLTEQEVTTSNFNISPVFEPTTNYRPGPITGYQVTNSVLVRTKKLDIAGKAIQAAVNAGANNVDFVSFGLSGQQGRDQAIAEAAKNARKDATALAAASGVTLGRVRHVAMSSDRGFPMMQMARMEFDAAGMGGAAPSLTPGAIRVQMSVTMEFDIHE